MHRAGLAVLALLTLGWSEGPSFVVPNSPDLTIRTRTHSGSFRSDVTLQLKGARQSVEQRYDVQPAASRLWQILQCDRQRRVLLNAESRTYAYVPIEDPSHSGFVAHLALVGQAGDPPATEHVTIDAVDTGERRRFGPLTARRVVTTTKTERRGARGGDVTMTEDGWYVDLPPPACIDWGGDEFIASGLVYSNGVVSRPTITRLGRAKRGSPLTTRVTTVTPDRTWVERTELVELSDRPIDPAVFEVPAGYRPALRLWYGGFDLTRPDTLLNRAMLLYEHARDTLWRRFWY